MASIEDNAFKDCTYLKSVTIPDTIVTIGEYAFSNCSELTGAILPNSVTTLGSFAFSGCSKLSSIIISNNILRLEDRTFNGCVALSSITIPASVEYIHHWAFNGCCDTLNSITFEKTTGWSRCLYQNSSTWLSVNSSMIANSQTAASLFFEENNNVPSKRYAYNWRNNG